jgi:hypothetical protein
MKGTDMEEFANLDEYELRKLLIDAIEQSMGKDYLLGWLKSAYVYGHLNVDTDKDLLIGEIRGFRDKATAVLKV